MDPVQICIAITVTVLAIVALVFFFAGKKEKSKKMSKLSKFAFMFILAGIFFGDYRPLGYGLMGIGLIFSIVDMIRSLKNN